MFLIEFFAVLYIMLSILDVVIMKFHFVNFDPCMPELDHVCYGITVYRLEVSMGILQLITKEMWFLMTEMISKGTFRMLGKWEIQFQLLDHWAIILLSVQLLSSNCDWSPESGHLGCDLVTYLWQEDIIAWSHIYSRDDGHGDFYKIVQ